MRRPLSRRVVSPSCIESPNPLSKTSTPCSCGWLERAAQDSELPIEFDRQLNEYHLRRREDGYWLIYHCPCCGGAAPRSKRDELFARVHQKESFRLHELTKNLQTLDQVLEVLGEPEGDLDAGVTIERHEENGPDQIETFRTLIYSSKSKTADILVAVSRTGQVASVTFQPKYIGDRGADAG